MKKLIIATIFLFTLFSNAQNTNTSEKNRITQEEIDLSEYSLDTLANAVVLFESGNTEFKIKNDKIVIETKYFFKIKIFKKEGYDNATFEIPLYNSKNNRETVSNITGFTLNGYEKTYLENSQIFKEKINENWKSVKFTMPNLKEGCIIQVEYVLNSPFKFNLTGWEFQSDIPKKFSQYIASVPGNYIYNRQLKGYLKLKTNSSTVKKNCFRVPGIAGSANCEEIKYEMENIPAFEVEDYMTDKDNFVAKIKFELAETIWFDGTNKKFTTTWEAVDKEFKTDKNVGKQLKKTSYFEKLIPIEIKSLESELERAKAIYSFIQNHFTWNKKNSIFKNVNVKNAFENKIGNVGEINISLINALKSVGLNTQMVLLSTRNNGNATKVHPIISDFNYIIAKIDIDNKTYLIDATEKLIPFGLLPYRCLNGYGRVMDFENDSYWIDIIPNENSKTSINVFLELKEDGSITGKLRKKYFGYDSYFKRKKIISLNEDDSISEFESSFNDLEVINYEVVNKDKKEKPLTEIFEIQIENFENLNTIFLNPYFDEKLDKNPFKLNNRLYPVDFGYPRKYSTTFSLEVPDNYKIESFPKNISLALPENSGSFKLLVRKNEDYKITLSSNLEINKSIYYNFEYNLLKELFSQTINSQKTPIVLKIR